MGHGKDDPVSRKEQPTPHRQERTFRISMNAKPRAPVWLNVYDLAKWNQFSRPFGFGAYHSGIQVHGTEYAYSGHHYPTTGIFEITPGDETSLGEPFKFKQSIFLGMTDFSKEEVREIVRSMGNEYTGLRYHIFAKNCNNFSNALSKALVGRKIPRWINRLAELCCLVPCIREHFPQEWIIPRSQGQQSKKDGSEERRNSKSEATRKRTPPSSSSSSCSNRAYAEATNTTTNSHSQNNGRTSKISKAETDLHTTEGAKPKGKAKEERNKTETGGRRSRTRFEANDEDDVERHTAPSYDDSVPPRYEDLACARR